jgi:hypothetical protein
LKAEEIVRIIFSNRKHPQYLKLVEAAGKTCSLVFGANARNLVYDEKNSPDIFSEIAEFKRLLAEVGVSIPEDLDSQAFFSQIMQPFHSAIVAVNI